MSNLHYLIRQPKVDIKNPPLLVLLHGYASNESDLFSFSEALPSKFLIVSLRAPYKLDNEQYYWYAIDFDATNNKFSDLVQAKKSLEAIASFIDQIKLEYNTDPDKTFLLGFSQGAILSYALSFNYPNKIQNVIALSGHLNQDLVTEKISGKDVKTDYYISHGTLDQVLPVDWARQTKSFLDNLNIRHTYSEYPVGHTVSPKNFMHFKSWIEQRL